MTALILSAYAAISRGRQYVGMMASPLPLSLRDVDTYLASRPVTIDRELLEEAIFALDDVYRDEWARDQNDEDGDED
ncbi:hypothetical protein [Tatumella sp. UCD-D_suzukii]|uniref:hypothetical protein n=1 Tax=Tatumella sp. UCD-D_suzukii TaxID=1408192 RepID=UPI00057181B8|nr:hypothetical protein [Tatumella sp. UCD-D_suzukii]